MPATIHHALLRASPEWRAPGASAPRYAPVVPHAVPHTARPALMAELITTEQAFAGLESEWTRLAAQVPDACLAQGFAWCWAGWCTTGRPRGRRLAVITVREAGRLVLVWPLAQRGRGLLSELIPLGSEATDYNPLLVAHSRRAETYVRAALALIRHETEAALLAVPLVREESPAARVLEAMAQGPGQAIALETLQAPFLDCGSAAKLASCDAAMSKNFRRGLERRRRRLEETGTLEFAVIDDAAGFAALLDWTIASKVEWLDRRGLKTPFLRSDDYRAFWRAAHASGSGGGRVRGMALRLDGQIIAAKIVVETHGRLEGFLTAFDPEYSRFSPGQILLRETFVWCAKAGLAYDFRIGDEAYKLEWTSNAANVTNYVLPLNRAGALLHRTRVLRREACAAKNRLRERIPTGVRRVLKELLLGGSPTAEA